MAMSDSFPELQEEIQNHPYFKKTKGVIEDNVCHSNESVYDHLLVTEKRAEEASTGAFITNPEAKELFIAWMNQEMYGMRYKEICRVIALLHDIGKILVYEEEGKQSPLNALQKDGTTLSPGHEYWGSTLVPKILSDVGVVADLAEYIARIVRLHGILMFPQFDTSKSVKEHISDMKTLGQGVEKEILFNIYVDVATCPLFKDWLGVVVQMFNDESLYKKREYVVI